MNRLSATVRRKKILAAAIQLAAEKNYIKVTTKDIAEKVDCSPGLITHYYPTIEHLRIAIVTEAISTENYLIIVQAHVNSYPVPVRMLGKAFTMLGMDTGLPS